MKRNTLNKKALIMVDLQNDFCLGGSLAVPDAEAIIPLANKLQHFFDLVIFTQDWHPFDHISFAKNHVGQEVGDEVELQSNLQVLWPVHCVQNTAGAAFHPHLNTKNALKVQKGSNQQIDSYSAFFDNNHVAATELEALLREQQVTDVYIMGLTTNFCVKFTCLDALALGFNVYLIEDACRGIELTPGAVSAALQEIKAAGGKIITSDVFFSAELS